jgi:hypothetical protein
MFSLNDEQGVACSQSEETVAANGGERGMRTKAPRKGSPQAALKTSLQTAEFSLQAQQPIHTKELEGGIDFAEPNSTEDNNGQGENGEAEFEVVSDHGQSLEAAFKGFLAIEVDREGLLDMENDQVGVDKPDMDIDFCREPSATLDSRDSRDSREPRPRNSLSPRKPSGRYGACIWVHKRVLHFLRTTLRLPDQGHMVVQHEHHSRKPVEANVAICLFDTMQRGAAAAVASEPTVLLPTRKDECCLLSF